MAQFREGTWRSRAAAAAIGLCAAGAPAAADMNDPLATRLTPEVVADLFPDADGLGSFEVDPPIAPVISGGETVGYLFSTHETVHPRGYAGHSFDIIVALDSGGVIRGHLLLEEHEPLIDPDMIEPEAFDRYLAETHGYDLKQRGSFMPRHVDGVSGATISAVAMRRAVLNAANLVGFHTGVVDDSGAGISLDRFGFEPRSWAELLAEGSVRARTVTNGEVRAAFARALGADAVPDAELGADDAPFITVYAALATSPTVGRNLLGERIFRRVNEFAVPGEHQLVLGSVGRYKWPPANPWMVDRIERARIVQGGRAIPLETRNYSPTSRIALDDAPELDYLARIAMPAASGFDALEPWSFEIAVPEVAADAEPRHVFFALEHRIPAAYVRGDLAALEDAGFREPVYAGLWRWRASTLSDWQRVWIDRQWDIVALALLLAAVTALFLLQHRLTHSRRLHRLARVGILAVTLVWLGWIAGGQVTILTVIAYLQAALGRADWGVILLDPLLVILCGYTALTLLLWGRGVFCGWLCPFGALQELLNRAARLVRIPQLTVPEALHQRLWTLKYLIGAAILALAAMSLATATVASEIEPFKTAITLRFARAWPYVAWAAALLVAGLFVERLFCRYLCPLGGVLAVLGRIHMLEWLKRRPECGNPCQICTHSCPIGAIDRAGAINMNECLQCLDCQVDYVDDSLCPPLVARRRRGAAAPSFA